MLTRPSFAAEKTFAAILILSAGFMAFTGWDQAHWWQAKEDYVFGWLVPAFVATVVWDRRAEIFRVSPYPLHRYGPFAQKLFPAIAFAGILLGPALFVLGALYRAAAGPSYGGTLSISLGSCVTILSAIFWYAPTAPEQKTSSRARITALFIFPCLVWLISAPMITVVENNLRLFLMRQITSLVFFTFQTLALPLEQQGNVLVLPTGRVGVEEACSGIRSLTGCIFAGSFLAAMFLRTMRSKLFLIVASLGLAVMMNLFRSLFLTAWAYRFGSSSIAGKVHDISGYAVLGFTLIGLLWMVRNFSGLKAPIIAHKAIEHSI